MMFKQTCKHVTIKDRSQRTLEVVSHLQDSGLQMFPIRLPWLNQMQPRQSKGRWRRMEHYVSKKRHREYQGIMIRWPMRQERSIPKRPIEFVVTRGTPTTSSTLDWSSSSAILPRKKSNTTNLLSKSQTRLKRQGLQNWETYRYSIWTSKQQYIHTNLLKGPLPRRLQKECSVTIFSVTKPIIIFPTYQLRSPSRSSSGCLETLAPWTVGMRLNMPQKNANEATMPTDLCDTPAT